jgi:hypothetical protein
MADAEDSAGALNEAARRLEAASRNFATANSNQSTVTLQAGGAGVWVATTCCLIMLFSGLMGAFWVSREFNQIDAQMTTLRNDNDVMRQYLSSIYQQAPWLTRPTEKQKEEKASGSK